MRFKLFIFFIFMIVFLYSTPKWYEESYPDSSFIIGKGCAEIGINAIGNAKNTAIKDISQIISCSISGKIINRSIEINTEKTVKSTDYFLSETKISTNLKIMNYRILNSQEENGLYYIMIGIQISELKELYKFNIIKAIDTISSNFAAAELSKISNSNYAVKLYEKCAHTLSTLSDEIKIYVSFNNWYNDIDCNSLPDINYIDRQLLLLTERIIKSPSVIATELLSSININSNPDKTFYVFPFEYENTNFVSELSIIMSELISNEIIQSTGWRKSKKSDNVFRGKILESTNGIYIFLSYSDPNYNDSNQIYINEKSCNKIGWDKIKPVNYKNALQNKLTLLNAIQTDSKLKVELQTEKMYNGPVIYYIGDEPKLYVKANKACFLRLIYIFSDNIKTLLIDNYPISNEMVNQWIQLPFEFEVSEPCGIEEILLQASTEKMPSIQYTKMQLDGGYINILSDNIEKEIVKTRGLKIKNPKKEITERSYQWTIFLKELNNE